MKFQATSYDTEQKTIERRRKMAEAMQAQSMQQDPINQMAGGYVIPYSPLQGLGKMAQALSGAYLGRKADTEEKELAGRRRQEMTDWIGRMPQARTETTQTPFDMASVGQDGFDEPPIEGLYNEESKTVQPTKRDQMTWALSGLQTGDPMAAAVAGPMLTKAMETPKTHTVGKTLMDETGRVLGVDSTWQAEQQAAREQKMQELQMRLQDQRLNAQERMALQRELQQQQIQARQDMLRLAASMRPPRQEPQPQVINSDAGPMILPRGSTQAVPVTGPDGQQLKPKGLEKALPTSAAQKLMENQQNLRRAEQALTLIGGEDITDAQGNVVAKGDPKATGLHNYLPDALVQRMDKRGVDTRAAIGDLGSLVIHDRSGAAVTAAEFPRLRPFIPQSTDDPATVKKKLTRFVNEYRNVVQEAADFYRSSGYKVPAEVLRSGTGGASASFAERRGGDRRGGLSAEEEAERQRLKAQLGK